eukprot:TRINITY_DN18301_c0_g1_i1.p1 TRINITY_DN18301_c0_g1~~TRINITY_DN18301_c0_g1_i1.p1  ORF type:complete len:162 (-),score=33.01 TRINITY_DN18301_c0_g1_i1:4-441(-)
MTKQHTEVHQHVQSLRSTLKQEQLSFQSRERELLDQNRQLQREVEKLQDRDESWRRLLEEEQLKSRQYLRELTRIHTLLPTLAQIPQSQSQSQPSVTPSVPYLVNPNRHLLDLGLDVIDTPDLVDLGPVSHLPSPRFSPLPCTLR